MEDKRVCTVPAYSASAHSIRASNINREESTKR